MLFIVSMWYSFLCISASFNTRNLENISPNTKVEFEALKGNCTWIAKTSNEMQSYMKRSDKNLKRKIIREIWEENAFDDLLQQNATSFGTMLLSNIFFKFIQNLFESVLSIIASLCT